MGVIKQAKKALPSRITGCLFCQVETPHDVIVVGLPRFHWFGPPSRAVRAVEVCRVCGNYSFLPRGIERGLRRPHPRKASGSRPLPG